jgi:hypothetical protein
MTMEAGRGSKFVFTQGVLARTSLDNLLQHLAPLVQAPLDRPPKPPALVKLHTGTPLGEALKVGGQAGVLALNTCGELQDLSLSLRGNGKSAPPPGRPPLPRRSWPRTTSSARLWWIPPRPRM